MKIKKTILLIILTAIVAIGGTYLFLENKSGVAIGKPCSYNGAEVMDTKGLQCYFYGEAPETGGRSGIWIKPDLRQISDWSEYKNYVSNWKKYTSPDKKISFSYPQTWDINILNWKDGVIGILMGKPADIPPIINIEKIEKNAVTVEDRIGDARGDGNNVLEDQIILNGSEATRLYTISANNITQDSISIFIDKGDYYVAVSAPIFNDPLYDFPTLYLLSTFKVD
ncbi:MAG: hypothetical protein Q8Q90_01600 [bacterium]|nr:hypothetical protein [bacterium]